MEPRQYEEAGELSPPRSTTPSGRRAGWFSSPSPAVTAAMRRLLAAMTALMVGIAVDHLVAGDQHMQTVLGILCAATAAALAFVALLVASASDAGLELMRRAGLATPSRGGRAAIVASVWFIVVGLCVHFAGEAFEPLPGGAWIAGAALASGLAAVTYHVHHRALDHDGYRTFNLVAMVLAAGSLAAMSATSRTDWWTLNFSTLGTSDDLAAFCFNAGIVVAGTGMAGLARVLTHSLEDPRFRARRGGVVFVRTCIVLLGASLAGVGLVPIDTATDLHNAFALGAALCFAVPAVALKLAVPGVSNRLVAVSLVLVAIEAVAMVLYDGFGLFNLTVFELVAFGLVFVWLIAVAVLTMVSVEASHAKRAVTRADRRPEPAILSRQVRTLRAARQPGSRDRVRRRARALSRAAGRVQGSRPVRPRRTRRLSTLGW
ncbi:hypothetical protein ARHIZOSPH14_11470 [Agromyces rhizosphaerae]|uniref:DUF998 domain-containing protein n=1 Tax=Agromyces rhizosphaerae TaxID=88374 RepID=A0A9W6CV22_9MICO|nr:hypothetical protein [Agromyces rhizosphaerae]GLI26905.1 hypothetical protein ARHIZOSPH14_11470 [Agromyces rhizosphaerae]